MRSAMSKFPSVLFPGFGGRPGVLAQAMLGLLGVLAACGTSPREQGTGADGRGAQLDGTGSNGSNTGGYPIYAHSDTVLYTIDLGTKALVTIGKFLAPSSDVITDLAVAPSGTIYVISKTALYTASATDGHVTKLGSLSACGTSGVALTTTANGDLWMGDFNGKLCKIDIAGAAPVVGAPVTMSGGYALAGDFVGVSDGTIFGTAYKLADQATQTNNLLVKIDVVTGTVTPIGSTGFPKLFGASFQNNVVFGFTHDGTGHVVTIDRTTGIGTIYATFKDPATNLGISFAGAGVSSLVVIE